jgi:hypothetical protein
MGRLHGPRFDGVGGLSQNEMVSNFKKKSKAFFE